MSLDNKSHSELPANHLNSKNKTRHSGEHGRVVNSVFRTLVGRYHTSRRRDQAASQSVANVLSTSAPIPPELTQEVIASNRLTSQRVHLNVGGQKHQVLWTTLEHFPRSRLGQLAACRSPNEVALLCDDLIIGSDDGHLTDCDKTIEYYFDRPSRVFQCIIDAYRTRSLHLTDDLCVLSLRDELTYWGLSEALLAPCCLHKFYIKLEQTEEEVRKTNEIADQSSACVDDGFGQGRHANCRRKFWDFLEKPQSSMSARMFAIISLLFIVLSIIEVTLSTIPELQHNSTQPANAIAASNSTANSTTSIPNPTLKTLEYVCNAWFTLEYVVRLLASPNKYQFVKSPMNLIDLIAILQFYMSILFDKLEQTKTVVQVFRILRIVRVFKLARHSQGLQALGYTLKESYKELGLLMMFVVLVVLIFSSLIYFAEKDDDEKKFRSIPDTFWWAIITITTVGYGDMVPKSKFGKFIGSLCCICGVIVIALPIPIIVNKFADFYKDQMRREKVVKHKLLVEQAPPPGGTGLITSDLDFRSEIFVGTRYSTDVNQVIPNSEGIKATTKEYRTTANESLTSFDQPVRHRLGSPKRSNSWNVGKEELYPMLPAP